MSSKSYQLVSPHKHKEKDKLPPSGHKAAVKSYDRRQKVTNHPVAFRESRGDYPPVPHRAVCGRHVPGASVTALVPSGASNPNNRKQTFHSVKKLK